MYVPFEVSAQLSRGLSDLWGKYFWISQETAELAGYIMVTPSGLCMIEIDLMPSVSWICCSYKAFLNELLLLPHAAEDRQQISMAVRSCESFVEITWRNFDPGVLHEHHPVHRLRIGPQASDPTFFALSSGSGNSLGLPGLY